MRRQEQIGDIFTVTIEGGQPSVFGGQLPWSLKISATTGPGLMDWDTVHFSTSDDEATILQRLDEFKALCRKRGIAA